MRKCLAVLAVVGVLASVGASDAMAVHYSLPLPRAKHIAREVSEYLCGEDCARYSWACERAGSGGAICLLGIDREDEYGDVRCESVLHLVIGAGGYLHEHFGEPHCAYVE